MTLPKAKPSIALKVLIWICLVPSFIGQFFKMMHWPGASILMLVGTLVFCFFYLPLFIIEQHNKESLPGAPFDWIHDKTPLKGCLCYWN